MPVQYPNIPMPQYHDRPLGGITNLAHMYLQGKMAASAAKQAEAEQRIRAVQAGTAYTNAQTAATNADIAQMRADRERRQLEYQGVLRNKLAQNMRQMVEDPRTPLTTEHYNVLADQAWQAGDPELAEHFSNLGKDRAPKAPLVQQTMPNPADAIRAEREAATAKKMAEVDTKAMTESRGNAQQAEANNADLEIMAATLSDRNVVQGITGKAALALKRMGHAIGMEVEGLGETELAQSLGNILALSNRREMPGPLSENDIKFLLAISPGIERSAESNRLILGVMMAKNDRIIDYHKQQQKWARKNNGTLSGFEEWWHGEYTKENPIWKRMAERGISPPITNKEQYEMLPKGAKYYHVRDGKYYVKGE